MSRIEANDIIDAQGLSKSLDVLIEKMNKLVAAMDKTYTAASKVNKTSSDKKKMQKEEKAQLTELQKLEAKRAAQIKKLTDAEELRHKARVKAIRTQQKAAEQQKELIRLANMEAKTDEQLRQKLAALKKIRDQVNRSTKAGSTEYARQTAVIQKLDAQVKRNNATMGVHNTNVGNYPKLAAGAIAAAGALMLAFRQVSRHVKATVDAFLVQQDVTQRVERQFGSYSDTIIKAAQETQKLTTVGDEEFMKMAIQAQNFGVANDKVNKTVQDSIGLSEMFKDAGLNQQTALKALANAQEGNYQQLERYIPALRSANTETEKQAILNDLTAKGFDMAQANANTYAGRLQQIKNMYGDLQEEIGGQFLEAIFSPEEGEKVINMFDRLIQVLNETQIISEFIGNYKQLFQDLFKPIDDLAQAFGLANDKGDTLAVVFKTLGITTKIAMMPLNLLISALSAITGFIKDLFTLSPDQWLNSFGNGVKKLLSPIKSLGQSLGLVTEEIEVTEKVVLTFEERLEKFTSKFAHLNDEQRKQIEETATAYLKAVDAKMEASRAEMKELALSGASTAELYREGKKLLEDYNSEVLIEEENLRKSIKEITKKNEVLKINNDELEDNTQNITNLKIEYEFLNTQVEKLGKLTKDLNIPALTIEWENFNLAIEDTRSEFQKWLDVATSGDIMSAIQARADAEVTAWQRMEQALDSYKQHFDLVYGAIDSVISGHFAKKQMELDNDQARSDKYFENLQEQYADDADRLEQENENKRIADEKLAQEQADLAKRQAAFDKIKALFDIGINTAVGIIKALAMTPPNPILAGVIGATGAIQGAVVAAQPLPQYSVGLDKAKKDHYGEVAEQGKPELMTLPDGQQVLFNKPSVVQIPKGASIDTAEQTQAKLKAMQVKSDVIDISKYQKKQIVLLSKIHQAVSFRGRSNDRDMYYMKKYIK